ncbi:MAG: hypothetical protein LBE76_05735 [Nitrososphaerota archaeon]|nr:hypothetical protein [Nitrososphaerota archaeon]
MEGIFLINSLDFIIFQQNTRPTHPRKNPLHTPNLQKTPYFNFILSTTSTTSHSTPDKINKNTTITQITTHTLRYILAFRNLIHMTSTHKIVNIASLTFTANNCP